MRKLIRRYTPSKEKLQEHKYLRMFGSVLHQPDLWHLNRKSVPRAFAVGLFWCMMPMPFQMIPSAFCAIKFKANMALSLALVWISNPLTMPVFIFVQILIGRWLLGAQVADDGTTLATQLTNWRNWLDLQWLSTTLGAIGSALLLGALITGGALAGISYFATRLLWNWHTRRKWAHRATSRAASAASAPTLAGKKCA